MLVKRCKIHLCIRFHNYLATYWKLELFWSYTKITTYKLRCTSRGFYNFKFYISTNLSQIDFIYNWKNGHNLIQNILFHLNLIKIILCNYRKRRKDFARKRPKRRPRRLKRKRNASKKQKWRDKKWCKPKKKSNKLQV